MLLERSIFLDVSLSEKYRQDLYWFIQKQIYLEPHGIGVIAQELEPWLPDLGDFGHII